MNTIHSKLQSTLQNLLKYDNAMSVKLLQMSLAFLLDPAINYQEPLLLLSTDYGVGVNDIKAMSQGALVLYGESLQYGSDATFLKRKCFELSLQQELVSIIVQVWTLNGPAISKHLLTKIVTQNQLLDLEWCFGVTSSCDDCDNVGKTFLQLKLVVGEHGFSSRSLFIELSLESFYQLLASLEKCKQFVDYVTAR